MRISSENGSFVRGGMVFFSLRARMNFFDLRALWVVKNKKSSQRGSFGGGHSTDIRGSFARISRPKTSVRAVKILEKKQAFQCGHPWPEGADGHDPKGFPKTSVRKTLGWIFIAYFGNANAHCGGGFLGCAKFLPSAIPGGNPFEEYRGSDPWSRKETSPEMNRKVLSRFSTITGGTERGACDFCVVWEESCL